MSVNYDEFNDEKGALHAVGPVSFWSCGASDHFTDCLPQGKMDVGVG